MRSWLSQAGFSHGRFLPLSALMAACVLVALIVGSLVAAGVAEDEWWLVVAAVGLAAVTGAGLVVSWRTGIPHVHDFSYADPGSHRCRRCGKSGLHTSWYYRAELLYRGPRVDELDRTPVVDGWRVCAVCYQSFERNAGGMR